MCVCVFFLTRFVGLKSFSRFYDNGMCLSFLKFQIFFFNLKKSTLTTFCGFTRLFYAIVENSFNLCYFEEKVRREFQFHFLKENLGRYFVLFWIKRILNSIDLKNIVTKFCNPMQGWFLIMVSTIQSFYL